MKLLYALYHNNLIWTICTLILTSRSSDSASNPWGNIPQRWCSSNDGVGGDTRIIRIVPNTLLHDRILNMPSCISSLKIPRYQCGRSVSSKLLFLLRGGGGGSNDAGNHQPPSSTKNNEPFITSNPSYQEPVLTLGDLEASYSNGRNKDNSEDDMSLQRVQNHGPQHRPQYPKLRPILAKVSTFFVPMQQHINQLYQQYPILTQITLACVVTFLAWHLRIQALNHFMTQYFICHRSRMTLWNCKFLSLLLSAGSHINIWHLLYNLMALLSFGPTVQSILERKVAATRLVRRKYQPLSALSSIDLAMWLLVLGAAMSGSIAYLLWNELCGIGSTAGGCLGLSSVTMSMLSIYASAYPNRILQFRVGGIIPIRLPADQILLLAFVGSIIGCLFPVIFKSKRSDGISHSGHLGGLIFGVAYYDVVIMNRRPIIDSFIVTFYKRFQRLASNYNL